MSKPPRTDPPTYLKISLPESLRNELDVLLYSPLQARVPHGAYSTFFETLARQALAQHQGAANGTQR
jgi:hypothetical protein